MLVLGFLYNNEVKDCHWFSRGDAPRDGGVCSHFALSRMSSSLGAEAVDRALSCAVRFETECVLSVEINVSIPSCFVYDRSDGIKMINVPKILEYSDEKVQVVTQDVTETRVGVRASYSRWVDVEYLPRNSKHATTERFYNASAWCVQLLRESVEPACWKELD